MASRDLPTDQRGDDQGVGLLGVEASRRRFLRNAAAGGAIAFGATQVSLSALASAAGAQTPTTAGTTPGSTPGSAPAASAGKAPTVAGTDLEIAIFGGSLELAAIALYDELHANGKLSPPAVQQARKFQMNHVEAKNKLAEFSQGQAPTEPNPKLLAEFTPKISAAANEDQLAELAGQLEDGLAATYQWAMGQIGTENRGWELAAAVATIIPVDGQQAVAWSFVIEPDTDTWVTALGEVVPTFQTDAGRYTPTAYPVTSK